MNKLISHILLFCFFILNTQIAFADKDLKLVLAIDLIRHGDRNPVKYTPKISNAWKKEEVRKLTPVGSKQAKLLGEKFREYYIDKTHLLPKNFQQDLIYVRSTNLQRTKKTARSVLDGMFPANSNKINIIVPLRKQDVFYPTKQEKNLAKQATLKHHLTANKSLILAIKKQLKNINDIFETEFSTTQDFRKISDLIKVSKIQNKPLLKKLSEKTKDNIIDLGDKFVLKSFQNSQMACLYAKDPVLHIADLLNSKHKQKYFLYAAHDANITAIASLLNFHLKKMPPYLSDLRFEMFQNTNDNKVFIRTSLDGKNIKICQSSNDCPLEEFVKTLRENAQNKCATFSY